MCISCRRLVCAECRAELQGKIYCNNCAGQFIRESPEPYKAKGNWFQRHLNWTAFLSWVALYPLSYLIGTLILNVNPYIPTGAYLAILYGVSAVWMFGIGGWVLRQKNRNLFHLLWLVIPFGWIVFLSLGNKADVTIYNSN
ncbi:hypothetical protein ES708_31867 [subsurface metagenome]